MTEGGREVRRDRGRARGPAGLMTKEEREAWRDRGDREVRRDRGRARSAETEGEREVLRFSDFSIFLLCDRGKARSPA